MRLNSGARTLGLALGLAVLLSLGAAAALVLIGQRPDAPDESLLRVQRSGRLVVGIDPSYPPFESLSPQGTLQGYDVDLAQAIADRLSVQPVFVSLDVGGIYEAVMAGKLDVAISSLAPAPEYTERLSFSHAYFNAGQVIVVRGNGEGVRELRDLDGQVVGVEASSEGDVRLRELAPQVGRLDVHPYSSQEALFDGFRRGEVTALVVDRVAAMMQAQREGGTVTDVPLSDEPFVIVSRRWDSTLSSAIDQALADLQKSGYLGGLEAKWLR